MQLMRFPPPPYGLLKRKSSMISQPKIYFARRLCCFVAPAKRKQQPSKASRAKFMHETRKFMQKAFDFFMQIIQRLFKPELCNEGESSAAMGEGNF